MRGNRDRHNRGLAIAFVEDVKGAGECFHGGARQRAVGRGRVLGREGDHRLAAPAQHLSANEALVGGRLQCLTANVRTGAKSAAAAISWATGCTDAASVAPPSPAGSRE
jgi:hypothetical protein